MDTTKYLQSVVAPVIRPMLAELSRSGQRPEGDKLRKMLVAVLTEQTSFPTTASEMTAEFLSRAIGKPVTDFEIKALPGENEGVLSDVFLAHVVYADKKQDSVAIKVGKANAEMMAMAKAMGIYTKEVRIFSEFLGDIPLQTPHIHFARQSPDGNFCIVMEDVSQEWYQPEFSDGLTDIEIKAMIHASAKLHGKFITTTDNINRSDHKLLKYLRDPTGAGGLTGLPPAPMLDRANMSVATGEPLWSGMKALCFDRIRKWNRAGKVTQGVPADILDTLGFEKGGKVLEEVAKILGSRAERVATIIHGDWHMGNAFFRRGAPHSVMAIDWQIAHLSIPGVELAQTLQMATTSPDKIMSDYLPDYYAELLKCSPPGTSDLYTMGMLIEDFKCGLLMWWYGIILLLMPAMSAKDPRFWDLMPDVGLPRILQCGHHPTINLMEFAAELYDR